MPKVSVIIPAFNSEKFIRETLESVFRQSYTDLELIVVDDGSTDGTRRIVESFENARYYFQANRGPAAARNRGWSLAAGEYLAFLDADDLWHTEMLKSCVDVLDTQIDIGAVHTNWVSIEEGGRVINGKSGWQPWTGDIFDRLLVHIPIITPGIVWRRSCLETIGKFDETLEVNDDWLNWLRIVRNGCRFGCIERPLVYRRIHKDNLTHRESKRVINWRLDALDMICQEYDIDRSLRDKAYAEIHWIATTIAVSEGRDKDAIEHFLQAVSRNPSLLDQRETYYALARPNRLRERYGQLDISSGISNLQMILSGLYAEPDLPVQLYRRKDKVWGMAWLCLAQIAYAAPSPAGQARKLLMKGLFQCPRLILHPGNLGWVGRIFLGKRLVDKLCRIKE